MTPQVTLTVLQARRIALAAQGFTRPRPGAAGRTVTSSHFNAVLKRLGFFQIDSVNVLVRAHYMPLFSRLGPYDRELLHRAAGRSPRRLFEYWAHVATFTDIDLWPAMAHRMATRHHMWSGIQRIGEEQPELVEQIYREVADRGPITARGVELALAADAPRDRSNWGWNWSEAKVALEYLFSVGRITAARRNSQFEREYDVSERVVPARVQALPPLSDADAHLVLVDHAARALGVATQQCLADYFRLQPDPAKAAIEELVETGVLQPVRIAGWHRQAYLHRDAARPRRVDARALLSPFDPLVFERTRTEKLFDFEYRIEIYVPEAKRQYGYYVLPFLLGDRIVARVDLKADRASSTLIVHGAWAESHAPVHTGVELAAELRLMADWLGLAEIVVGEKGDLAPAVAAAVSS